MKLLKVLFVKASPLVLLLNLFSCRKVAALAESKTVTSLHGNQFHNGLSVHHVGSTVNGDQRATHSRGKRFIAFPVGSSFSTAVCMTTGVIGNPATEYLSMGLNWGIAYDLPNSTWVLQHASGFDSKAKEETVSPQIKRRHRRDLYGKLETLLNGVVFIALAYTWYEFALPRPLNLAFPKKEACISNVAATKDVNTSLSLFMTPHVAADIDILAINNFYENYFNRNQINLKKLKSRTHGINDIELLSTSVENCSKTSKNFTRRTCDIYATKLGDKYSRDGSTTGGSTKIQQTKTTTANIDASSLSPASSLLLQTQRLLSRPKRYLSFPEGSSFSVAVCFTVGIIGNPRYNYMSFGLNWGVAYDLPNTTWILNHLHGFAKQPVPVAVWHRRSRRSLYKEIENIVDNMGYNGRDCVLRALCESRQYFQKTKMGMIGEMLRSIFSLPKQRIFTRELVENVDIELYDKAYRKARSIVDCADKYECGFSLLELAFGKYSTPPDGYYTEH